MSQNAVVKKNVSKGIVEVSLLRELECGSGCKSCEGCSVRPTQEILALASDPIGVEVGDWVEVETSATGAIGAAMLIYLLPCVTLLIGYLVGDLLGFDVIGSLACAVAGLLLGFLPAVAVDRKNRSRNLPEFVIIKAKQV